MIIRHDIDPELYLTDADKFPAVFAIASTQQEMLTPYDKIDELLKPNLMPAIQTEPKFYTCCDGMGTLIRPSWILTAAHVATELSAGAGIDIKEQTYAIKEIFLHPGFLDRKLDYATEDLTAIGGEDYGVTIGTITFEPGETTQTVRVSRSGLRFSLSGSCHRNRSSARLDPEIHRRERRTLQS